MSVHLTLQTSTAPDAGEVMEFGRLARALRVDPKSSLAVTSQHDRRLKVVIDLDTVILALEAYSDE